MRRRGSPDLTPGIVILASLIISMHELNGRFGEAPKAHVLGTAGVSARRPYKDCPVLGA